MKNVLIIGGAGFIGSNLIGKLIERDAFRIFVVEPENADTTRIEHLPIHIISGNISDIGMLESILVKDRIQIVIHMVSTIIPGSSYEDFKREFSNVIFPSIRLMELCCKWDLMFVYFSSGGTIYGNKGNTKVLLSETDEMAPISYYGWTKQMMENSILYLNRTQGLRYLTLRPSNAYGPGQNLYGNQGFIAVALGKIIEGDKVEVWGDGSSVRDFIYIDDLTKAVADLLEKENAICKTLNIKQMNFINE